MQGFKNRRYEYEEKFVLGSGDSHSDSCSDGGTDRTGNYELHGLRTVLNYELHTVQIIASEKDNISSISLVIWRIFCTTSLFSNVSRRKRTRAAVGSCRNCGATANELASSSIAVSSVITK